MRKTRHLFKKIRDTNGTFHVKMGTIKDRNSVFDSVCDRNRLCIVACLFDLYVEYTMQNAGLDETQAGIQIAINNLRYADDSSLTAESKEELKSLLMKVKEKSEKAGLNSTFKKQRSLHPVPSFHGK